MKNIKFFMLARNMDQDEILDGVVKGVVGMFCKKHINPRVHNLEAAMQIGKADPIQEALDDLSMAVVTAGEVLESTIKEFHAAVKVRKAHDKNRETLQKNMEEYKDDFNSKKKDRQATNPEIRTVPFSNEEKDVETSGTCDDCEHVDDAEKIFPNIPE